MNDDLYPQWISSELREGENAVLFFTAEEVAPMFRVAKSTVLTWRRQGIIRAVRTPGRALRFPHTEIRRLREGAVRTVVHDVP